MSAHNRAVFSSYRNILRATRIAFQGDIPTLQSARAAIKGGLYDGRNLSVTEDAEEIGDRLKHLEDVAQFLKSNIVQGQKVDEKENKYRLKIHEYTELGDNDSIKKGSPGSGCCSGQ